jgi:hypothetical protein
MRGGAVSEALRSELSHPFFARFYRRNRQTADRRGEREHRRLVLEGLRGRVVEIGTATAPTSRCHRPRLGTARCGSR